MPSNNTPKTILLRGKPNVREDKADAAITPGDLLILTATGVKRHDATSTARFPCYVAREPEWVGGSISTDYAANDRVSFYVGAPGDEFYMTLESGANVARGARLTSNAAGKLEAASTNYAAFEALEAVDASAAAARIRVRVI